VRDSLVLAHGKDYGFGDIIHRHFFYDRYFMFFGIDPFFSLIDAPAPKPTTAPNTQTKYQVLF